MFQFDQEEALDALTIATELNDEHHMYTFYAVICIAEEGVSSHGGFIVTSVPQVIDEAERCNVLGASENLGCRYVPVAIGYPIEVAQGLFHQWQQNEGEGH